LNNNQPFPDGSRICFLGDSITAQNKYLTWIVDGYKNAFPTADIRFYNCAFSGGTVSLLNNMFDTDVLPHKPTHIVIMCGVNDSNLFTLQQPRSEARYTTLEKAYVAYQHNLEILCEKASSQGIEVLLMTPPPYDEYQPISAPVCHGGYALLQGYADVMRCVASKYRCPMIDCHKYLTTVMQEQVIYKEDRVHPDDLGCYYIAKCFLESQSLSIRPFGSFPAYLEEWHSMVWSQRYIYAVEHMVLPKGKLTLEEKLAFVQKYLADRIWDVPGRRVSLNDFFKKIAENYLICKPIEQELPGKIEKLYQHLTSVAIE